MGDYTKGLFKKDRHVPKMSSRHRPVVITPSHEQTLEILDRHRKDANPPRLVSCAIIRDGVTHSYGFKNHADIRSRLGDEDPYKSNPADCEGFLDEEGTFLTRHQANSVASRTGQCQSMMRRMLSSDIDW